jgi:hypothetical protein
LPRRFSKSWMVVTPEPQHDKCAINQKWKYRKFTVGRKRLKGRCYAAF